VAHYACDVSFFGTRTLETLESVVLDPGSALALFLCWTTAAN
jgi:hypothetical protein